MKKEWLLLSASVVMTLVVALGLIRWLAPHLLGISTPVDLEVVQVDRAVPPFYDLVFPSERPPGKGSLINDPYTGHRRRPMVPENNLAPGNRNAPFDLLGFRNRSVPVVADVVTLGDSLTVGPNATVDQNWPGLLRWLLRGKRPTVYNMAVGGWGTLQYLYMFDKAAALRPRVVVVAISTGGEPRKAVRMAYTNPRWGEFRRSAKQPAGAPSHWPPKDSEAWPVTFADGQRMVFTPLTRLTANDRRFPGTGEGYAIVAEAARRIAARGRELGLGVVFTVIPNKELVYAEKVRREGIQAPEAYRRLVEDEALNLGDLARVLASLPGASYVDVAGPLQGAALGDRPLYPSSLDGHPLPSGYAVIARALEPVVGPLLPDPPADGLMLETTADPADPGEVVLVRHGGVWRFASAQVFRANGWRVDPRTLPRRTARDLAQLPFMGILTGADPARFGPPAAAP